MSSEDQVGTAETGEPEGPDRRRVRERLLAKLDLLELRRPRAVSATEQAKRRDLLVERLAYMTAENLDALAEQVAALAGGPWRNEWPGNNAILMIARRIQAPRPEEDRLVTSFMRSAAGRRAWEVSPLLAVELVSHLVQKRRPPDGEDMRGIEDRARRRRTDLDAARRREAEDRASDADRALIASAGAAMERTRALVFAVAGQAGLGEAA